MPVNLSSLRRAGRGRNWLGGLTPAVHAERRIAERQEQVLESFSANLKRKAGGRLRPGTGIVPVKTGELRNSLRIIRARGSRPALVGAFHGYLFQRRFNLFSRAWRSFDPSRGLGRLRVR